MQQHSNPKSQSFRLWILLSFNSQRLQPDAIQRHHPMQRFLFVNRSVSDHPRRQHLWILLSFNSKRLQTNSIKWHMAVRWLLFVNRATGDYSQRHNIWRRMFSHIFCKRLRSNNLRQHRNYRLFRYMHRHSSLCSCSDHPRRQHLRRELYRSRKRLQSNTTKWHMAMQRLLFVNRARQSCRLRRRLHAHLSTECLRTNEHQPRHHRLRQRYLHRHHSLGTSKQQLFGSHRHRYGHSNLRRFSESIHPHHDLFVGRAELHLDPHRFLCR